MQQTRRILIVDDDPDITKLLEIYLLDEGFDVEVAFTAQEMDHHLANRSFDLILLDILLPDGDGFDITRRLREASDTAIILISRKNTDVDQIVGLELGADDYVTKPLEPRALLARIKSVLRRYKISGGGLGGDEATKSGGVETKEIKIGEWELDTVTHRLIHDDGTLHILSANETALLRHLVQNEGQVQTRNDLMLAISGREWEYMDRTIDIMIVRLRKIVEPDPGSPRFIQTVRGIGYVFQSPKNGGGKQNTQNDVRTTDS
ncbi:response regulator [Thalassospira australica]|uniref:response regulator n=1 Tax=Thalassospira australica TaxID=1528106 RepID=UPI00138DEEEF|nr:response regulator [Thalassospira australica]